MPVLSTDTSGLIFSAANQQWFVKAGVVISAAGSIAVVLPFAGGQLINHGDISSQDAAIALTGGADDSTFIFNGTTGSIIGSSGIVAGDNSSAGRIFNEGSIIGLASFGIDLGQSNQTEVHNDGYIYGNEVGVRALSLGGVSLFNSGVIESGGVGVSLFLEGGSAKIVNTGTISGDSSGMILNGASYQLVNHGLIAGDVTMSAGTDTYNGRKGVVDGVVFGSGGNDTLVGGADDDELHGDGDRDVLRGRGGDDTLIGGSLGDTLKGGSGADNFVYGDTSDSQGNSALFRDTIRDFDRSEDDRIDLRPLDAAVGAGNQKFIFLGTDAFSGAKGELRYSVDHGDAIVEADVNGDGNADLTIQVLNIAQLTAADFHL